MMKKNLLLCIAFFMLSVSFAQQLDTLDASKTPNDEERDTLNSTTEALSLPVFTTSSSDMSGGQNQDVNALLVASRDIFMQTVGMHFITARFRYRGYNSDNMTVMMNGVRLNNLNLGTASWSTWGGMNDVIQRIDMKTGLGASRSTFGDVGGYFNLNIYASSFRKGFRVTYSRGNRIFKNRASLTYSTGQLKGGWAISFSGTMRESSEGYVPGTFFQGYGYYLGIDKKLGEKNLLSLTGFGAPIIQGRSAYETMEAYQLTGNKHYNSLWGFQTDSATGKGQSRNARVSTTNKPTIILSDLWKINDHTKLTLSGFYTGGRTSLTNLNYNDDNPPAPDYYQYLPSYYNGLSYVSNQTLFNQLTYNWQNNINDVQQIRWDQLYNANRMNLYTVQGVDGSTNSYTGKRSKYIVEEARQDLSSYGFNGILNSRVKDYFLTGGINVTQSNTRYYKVVNDLLGGDFWLDVDQFSDQLNSDPLTVQNNVKDPNRLIKKGDVFGYDYNINVNRAEAWGQAERSFRKFDVYLSATVNQTSFYRDGHMENGKFLDSSIGKSKTLTFLNYGVKGGFTYKINGRNYVTVNAAFITKPPLPTNSFISPETRNAEITGLQSEKILSGDITYNISYPWLKGRITYFYSQINDQVWERSYYDDVYKTNVNYFMTNLNQLNQGVEFGLEVPVLQRRVSIIGAGSAGSYIYTNRPTATISADNTAQLLAQNRTIYFTNYNVGGMPQVAMSIGTRYNGKNWFAGIYYNYFANNYVIANPDRRTAPALAKYTTGSSTAVNDIIHQEKLPEAYTVDIMAGKSFRFKKFGLNFTGVVSNLTNNIFLNSGEEQLRHDVNNIARFPNKYTYSNGLTFMVSAAVSF